MAAATTKIKLGLWRHLGSSKAELKALLKRK